MVHALVGTQHADAQWDRESERSTREQVVVGLEGVAAVVLS
jgi:hypothetical protein